MNKKCQNCGSEHIEKAKLFGTFGKAKCFQLFHNRKSQLDMKGMAIKYVLAFFFVAVTVVALSQIGIIGKVTPGGGVKDLGVTGPGHMTAAVVAEENDTEVNETAETDNNVENIP